MNCATNHLSVKKHLESMARKSGVLVGLPITEVEGHEENAMSCGKNHLSFEQLLALCIGVDSCGKPAIRVKYIDSCETMRNCTNNDKDPLLNQTFAYDAGRKTFALVLNVST
jgi:hypothetical protein